MRLVSIALLAAGLPCLAGAIDARTPARQLSAAAATHVCPMHPDVRTSRPGSCPRCGMPLVPVDPSSLRDYQLDVRTTPHPPAAGKPFRLRLVVRDPGTGEVVRHFTEVHERRFHLFVVSQDLSHYGHVHPEQQRDGSWALDVTLPRRGFYKLFADFLPDGGTPQVIPRALVTAGFTGDLASSGARLTPDQVSRKRADTMNIELVLPRAGLVAGRDERLVYRLTEAPSGSPIADIEPYLGAWGHTLIMSEDTLHLVHAHPVESLPQNAGATGGPELTFKALLPAPGRYRVWTQLKRRGELTTVAFTIAVASPSSSSPASPDSGGRPPRPR